MVASQIAKQLRDHQPAAGWQAEPEKLSIGTRLIVTFKESREGVEARILEPGQPGDDDPPVTLRTKYEVTNFAYRVEVKASLLGRLSVHGLRPNAVYEVIREFHDYHQQPFTAGTRLTYISRDFLPYHGGHTIRFAEATMYLQEDDEACRQFADYVAVAAVP